MVKTWLIEPHQVLSMSRNEKIIKSVEANFALEGMNMSPREKANMMNYLDGKISFNDYLGAAIARHKRGASSK